MHLLQKIKLNFDLNDGCNLDCIMCGGRNKPANQNVIPLEVVKENLLPLFRHMTEFQLGCQFEPLLLPYFDQLAHLIGLHKSPTQSGSCVSNGTLLSEQATDAMINSGAFNRLRFSWDGSNRQIFEKIRRGANFDRTLLGLKRLIALRDAHNPQISIEFNITLLPENCHDLSNIVKLAGDLGINKVTTHKLYPNDYKWVNDEYHQILQRHILLSEQIASERGTVFEGQQYRTRDQYEREEQERQRGHIHGKCRFSSSNNLALILEPSGKIKSPCRKLHKPLADIFSDSLVTLLSLGMHDLLKPHFEIAEECCLTCHLFIAQQEKSVSIPAPAVMASNELPIHFFTIVLNGEPFIRHHLAMFQTLPFKWHWHIVEGVASQVHDSSWCARNGGRITEELHANGLSNDGTTEYLDKLAQSFPEQVTIYRKSGGHVWEGKLEMVNAPLTHIAETSLLWQVDCDEFWNRNQIIKMREMFMNDPNKTSARFICNFYVGPGLAISSVNTYGNNTHYEWHRCWKYETGDRWISHSPPILGRSRQREDGWIDVNYINPFEHLETSRAGLIFDHYAYTTRKQLAFKEVYYGYSTAVESWQRLQKTTRFPFLLRDYFPWVHDQATVDQAPLSTVMQPHVIYLRTDAIGDNILSASMLPHLKKRYPGSLITVVCQDRTASLYDDCPFVDGVIAFNYVRLMTQPNYRQLVLDKMNRLRPALLVNPIYSHDLHDEFLAHHCHALFKITCQGNSNNRDQAKLDAVRDLYSLVIANNPEDHTELDHHRTFLAGIGIRADRLAPQVWTSRLQEQWADELLHEQGIAPGSAIMLFPGALLDCKTYPHYAGVVAQLGEHPLIVLGGTEQAEQGDRYCLTHGGTALNLAGKTSLGQMAALMRRGKLYLGSDSSGLHIACAVGLRNVVLLGGGHFGRFCPYSPLTTAVCLPLACYDCNWRCPHSRVHCLHDIRPETVLQAIRCSLNDHSVRTEPVFFPQLDLPAADSPLLAPELLEGSLKISGETNRIADR